MTFYSPRRHYSIIDFLFFPFPPPPLFFFFGNFCKTKPGVLCRGDYFLLCFWLGLAWLAKMVVEKYTYIYPRSFLTTLQRARIKKMYSRMEGGAAAWEG